MKTAIKYHTKEAAISAVTENGRNLEFCSKELQNDEEVVMTAVKQDSLSFYHASDTLKSNKAFIMNALNEGIRPWCLITYANTCIHSDIEVISLAIEKSHDGWEFNYAQGEVALNKDLAAKALVKWGAQDGSEDPALWEYLNPTLQEYFPKDSFYEKAKSYLVQLEQEKQAEIVSGGSTEEDEVVW